MTRRPGTIKADIKVALARPRSEDDSEVFYQMSEFYSADHSRGVRWNDPAFGIRWPDDDRTISSRDRGYPDFPA